MIFPWIRHRKMVQLWNRNVSQNAELSIIWMNVIYSRWENLISSGIKFQREIQHCNVSCAFFFTVRSATWRERELFCHQCQRQKYVITLFAHLWNVIVSIKSHIEQTRRGWVGYSSNESWILFRNWDFIWMTFDEIDAEAASTHRRINGNIQDEKLLKFKESPFEQNWFFS